MSRLVPSVSFRPRTLALAGLGVLAASALFTSPGVASADQWSARPQTNVHYTLQELSTDEGTRAVYRRIRRAAERVCPAYDSLDLEAFAVSKECQRQAIARAVAHIGNARLAAIDARAARIAKRG